MKTFDDIKYKVNTKLQHDLTYAEERNELVKGLLSENDWIIDLVSMEEVRSKQIKTKKDFLAEDQKLDKTLEQIADYILFPKFDDEDEEHHYEYLHQKECELNEKRKEINRLKKNDNAENELDYIKEQVKGIREEISAFQKDYLSITMQKKNAVREKLESFMDKVEETYGLIVKEDNMSRKNKHKNFSVVVDDAYWDKMGFSDGRFRQGILNEYENTINDIQKQLGLNIKDGDERNKYTENLIKHFDKNKLVFDFGDRIKIMNGQERYFKLRKMYGEIVSDCNKAKEMLTMPISFQSPTAPTTHYEFNTDTWYEDNDGNIVELSKNMISFSDPNTYKGLIVNYYDLDDAYESKFNSNMWGILRSFEQVLNEADLTDEERFVVARLMKDRNRQDIIDEFLDVFHKDLSHKVLSTWVNNTIPNKLVRTYLELIDEWVYTYWIKGDYKKCSSCGEPKLISNDRYFYKKEDSRDKFHNKCINCMKS